MEASMKAETYLPQSAKELEVVSNFLAAFQVGKGKSFPQRYLLVGAKVGEQVQLPEEFYQVLVQVVEVMKKGMAVTVAPQAAMLTTQEAANIIGISRPTLISLLEKGLIEFELVGRHRRISIDQVLKYRAARKEQQYRALDDLYDASEDALPSDYLSLLQKVRKPDTGTIQKPK
ncbi:MAG TPA: excisionase family DNA-binding protein [Candidatus Paceibacterota bacterium]|nr:excisionase family DNA-binding protein [Candidatus Paceibacterota bacterium]